MTPHPTEGGRTDVLEFGGSAADGPRNGRRLATIVLVAALAVALGLYWSLRSGHETPPTRAQGTSPTGASVDQSGAPVESGPPLLHATGYEEFGYTWPPPKFWFAFSVVPTNVTRRSVHASLDPLVGVTDARVLLYSDEDAKRYAMSGKFTGDAMTTLTAGAQFAAVIVMTPVCAALPEHQPITIHVRFASPTGPEQLDIADTPDLLLDDMTAAGACGHGSGQ